MPHEQRALDLLTVLSPLEENLFGRATALNQLTSKAGSTAASVVAELLSEISVARAPAGPALPAADSGAAATTSPLSDGAFDAATNRHPPFVTMAAALSASTQSTNQGQIDTIGIGFEGSCIVAVKTLMSTTAGGDPDARKNASLRLLNSLRPVRHLYFDYVLTIDLSTGVVPPKFRGFHFAEPGRLELMNHFLNRQYSTMDWISAPHGVLGYEQHRCGNEHPAFCHPLDHYCQPILIKRLGDFGHRLFISIGTSPVADATGFTFESMCARYSDHLEFASSFNDLDRQLRWLREAVNLFRGILSDISMWIILALQAPDAAGQNLSGRPLVLKTDPHMSKLLENEKQDEEIADLRKRLGFAGASSSSTSFNANQLPLLSQHDSTASKLKGLKKQKIMPEEPPTAPQGLPPGSNTGLAKWANSNKVLVTSGLA